MLKLSRTFHYITQLGIYTIQGLDANLFSFCIVYKIQKKYSTVKTLIL
jgi:hypothetical protein